MKNFLKILILPIVIITMLAGFAPKTFAVAVTTVEFEQAPLFSSVNFAPGDSVSRWVKLNNTTSSPHRAILRTINVVNDGELGDAIGLVIKQGDTVLYDNTFTDLFGLSELVLPQVPAGSSTTLDFIATFKTTAGDEYQNSTIGFNLQIGFEDLDVVVDDSTTIIGGEHVGGGGGSGGSITIGQKNLIISGESVNSTATPQSGVVLITWNTNIPATSQVVYGLTSGGPYSLNLTSANFGYALGTTEIDISPKVEFHSVQLTGLIPNQLYSYRVVSRASPPTVSNEYTFMLNEDGTINTNTLLAIASQENVQKNPSQPQPQQGAGGVVGTNTLSAEGASATTGTTTASTTIVGNNNNLAATALLAGFSFGNMFYVLLAILLIAIIIGSFWYYRRARGARNSS